MTVSRFNLDDEPAATLRTVCGDSFAKVSKSVTFENYLALSRACWLVGDWEKPRAETAATSDLGPLRSIREKKIQEIVDFVVTDAGSFAVRSLK